MTTYRPPNYLDVSIDAWASRSERVMQWLELGAAYFLVVLFAIGVFDLGVSLYELINSGTFTDPNSLIDLIDTVLVLLIIVEVFETVVASSRREPVVRIVINAGLIAIARKVISYRPSEYESTQQAFIAAASFTLLLVALIGAFYAIRRIATLGIDKANSDIGTPEASKYRTED
ncbi:MAG: putative membrane protein [Haloquadratum walsbyi J07HQW2]|uniref:Putative membrane protein n=1 Tax=Haloquadratum walsbyi J07HQW2 TaxID=1238425 RepID=U1PV00_9EURY|nr:MAG: putative membrane protein [Haloquadratum walsbyi J07HQW2]